MTFTRSDPRRVRRDLDPLPAEVLSKTEMKRAARVRQVHRLAVFWHLDPSEIRRGLFVDWLIEHERMGKGDWN